MAARTVRRRGRHPDRRCRRRVAPRRGRAPGDVGGRVARLCRGCPRAVRDRFRVAASPGERAVPGRLPARHRTCPAADRAAPGRGGRTRGRRRGRPRLHRQGQRPGPVRRRRPCAGSGPRGRGADARRHGPVARAGDRLRGRARDRDPDHEGFAVLDRRQPVGPLGRDRRARGPLGRAARRRVRVDGRPVRGARSGRADDRVRGRDPGRRSTGHASRRSSSSTGWRPWPGRTASGGSTTSRTGSSGSRAARSTRRRPLSCSMPRIARSRG